MDIMVMMAIHFVRLEMVRPTGQLLLQVFKLKNFNYYLDIY